MLAYRQLTSYRRGFLPPLATRSSRCLPRVSSSLRCSRRQSYSSSSSTTTKQALLVWVCEDESDLMLPGSTLSPRHSARRHPLLIPSQHVIEHTVLPDDGWNIVDLVEDHYSKMDDDVGGMGESDRGVWLASVGDLDILDHCSLIQETVEAIKEHRHGVPFRLYSCGRPTEDVDWEAIKRCKLQVSLFAPTPKEYIKITGGKQKDFNHLCGFIATAAEMMKTVEIGVLQEYEAPTHALAASLGAQEVFAYSPTDYVHVLETN